MRVELLVTGDELLSGAIADTNSAWLLHELVELGIRASRITTVGDAADEIAAALRDAAARSDVVVVSGGLGPTSDDLTAAVAAQVAGVPLVTDEPTLERIQARWKARGRSAPAQIAKQAQIPQNAQVLVNDEGSAPGFRLRIDRAECWFFAGVPREFRHLCSSHLFPSLSGRAEHVIRRVTLRCVGIAESEVDQALADLPERFGIRLGLRAIFPETHVSISVDSSIFDDTNGVASVEAELEAARLEALRRLGDRCYGINGDSLAAVVGRLCIDARATLSVAESCTGGLLGAEVTRVAGSSAWFLGGALVYSNEEKSRALGVPETLLREHGAVSEAVVRAMADGIRSRTGASHALAITGIAGPGGGTEAKPVGTVWIGLASPQGTLADLYRFTPTSRDRIREASVAAALDLLRRQLLGPATGASA